MNALLTGDAFSALALEDQYSGWMTRALGFSLGMIRASAFGVLGVSSWSLKKGTLQQSSTKNDTNNESANNFKKIVT